MNAAFILAVVLSLFSAVAYAAAAVAQERLAARSPGTGLLRLMSRGAWWGAVLLNAAAALLHIVALKYGPLTVVQPLGALTLVAAVPLGARVAGRRVTTAEWRGTAFTLAGLAALLATASGPAPDDVLGPAEALAVAATTAALIGLLSWPGTRPGLRHATASGLASGVASALTQTVTVAATDRTGPLLGVQVIGVAVLVAALAVGGLLLSQTAYKGGLGAPLAMVTLTNPVAAALIGLTLLGERLQGGPTGILMALTGAGLASWGVVLLSRGTQEQVPAASVVSPGTSGTEAVPAPSAGTPGTEQVPVPAAAPEEPAVSGASGPARLPAARTPGGRRRGEVPTPAQAEPVDARLVA
jgi:drug/metabolite transporter (DMT)-like permease